MRRGGQAVPERRRQRTDDLVGVKLLQNASVVTVEQATRQTATTPRRRDPPVPASAQPDGSGSHW